MTTAKKKKNDPPVERFQDLCTPKTEELTTPAHPLEECPKGGKGSNVHINYGPPLTQDELAELRQALVKCARSQGLQGHSASDIVQSAIRATLAQPKEAHTFAYFFRTLRNKVIDRFRRRKREVVLPTDEMPLTDSREELSLLDKLVAKSENAAFIRELIPILNEKEMSLLRLKYLQSMPRAEIITRLEWTEGQYGNSVRQLHNKAKIIAVKLGIVIPEGET